MHNKVRHNRPADWTSLTLRLCWRRYCLINLMKREAERLLTNLFSRLKSPYGSPRMTVELNETGFSISENAVAKLMARQRP